MTMTMEDNDGDGNKNNNRPAVPRNDGSTYGKNDGAIPAAQTETSLRRGSSRQSNRREFKAKLSDPIGEMELQPMATMRAAASTTSSINYALVGEMDDHDEDEDDEVGVACHGQQERLQQPHHGLYNDVGVGVLKQVSQYENEDSKANDNDNNDTTKVVRVITFWDAYQGRGTWAMAWDHFLYPPNLPRPCQLLRPENIAIPACYLLVGLLQGLSSVMVTTFPLDLQATEAQQTTLRSLRSLPASLKLLFGFWSDNVPILGYRRKPYMFIGWGLASLSQFALLFFSNVQLGDAVTGTACFATRATTANATDDGDSHAINTLMDAGLPTNAPTIPFFAACLLAFGWGFWLADVMGDSMVAEKAKLEPAHSRGSVQSACYSYRFFGLMMSAPFATYLYTAVGPLYVVRLLALLPLATLPLVYRLEEVRHDDVASTWQQCQEIWNTVSSRAVWQPLGFVFIYNVLQVGNGAWFEFQRTVLHFTSCQINLLGLVANVLLYVGILTYKYYLMHYSWRNIYVLTTLANGFLTVFQVLLIYGITFGLPPFWFALGDDVFLDFLAGIQFLPTTIMMVHLCPEGSEGASYAMFTTVHNAALTLSSSVSTLLLGIWDVSKKALAMGDVTGLANLTYLTTGLQISGLLFVGCLPHYKEDLVRLTNHHSGIGGFVFLAVTLLSVGYSIYVSLMNIMFPGWSGES